MTSAAHLDAVAHKVVVYGVALGVGAAGVVHANLDAKPAQEGIQILDQLARLRVHNRGPFERVFLQSKA